MTIDREFTELSVERAKENVRRNLVHYHPVYHSAALWTVDDDGENPKLVATYVTKVVVEEKPE